MAKGFVTVVYDSYAGQSIGKKEISLNISHILYMTFSRSDYPRRERVFVQLTNGDGFTIYDPESVILLREQSLT